MEPRHHRLERAVACLIALLLISWLTRTCVRETDSEMFYRYEADTLKCAIMMNHGMYSNDRRNVGFNYELLGQFADHNGSYAKILPPVEGGKGWEAFLSGDIDIAVINSQDTLPQEVASSIIASVPIEGDALWAVTSDNRKLINAINFGYQAMSIEEFFKKMSRRYFRSYKTSWLEQFGRISSISPYDNLIKKYAGKIGIDWRLLSSIIYQESYFSIGASSSKNAQGLMQIKESTAAHYGVDNIYDPEGNVKAGTMHLGHLLKKFNAEGMDRTNAIKFALAAYNAGETRIDNLRQKAAEAGFNPYDWESTRKSFRRQDGQTCTYVAEIMERYELYCRLID